MPLWIGPAVYPLSERDIETLRRWWNGNHEQQHAIAVIPDADTLVILPHERGILARVRGNASPGLLFARVDNARYELRSDRMMRLDLLLLAALTIARCSHSNVVVVIAVLSEQYTVTEAGEISRTPLEPRSVREGDARTDG